jgi:hypothetical protein
MILDERATDMLILQCCLLLELVEKDVSIHVKSFLHWVYLFHPDICILPNETIEIINKFSTEVNLKNLDRTQSKLFGKHLLVVFGLPKVD